MNARNRPVIKTSDTQSAAITNSLAQDFPRVRQIVAVPPGRFGHRAKMLRLGLSQPKRHYRFHSSLPVLLDFMRGHLTGGNLVRAMISILWPLVPLVSRRRPP